MSLGPLTPQRSKSEALGDLRQRRRHFMETVTIISFISSSLSSTWGWRKIGGPFLGQCILFPSGASTHRGPSHLHNTLQRTPTQLPGSSAHAISLPKDTALTNESLKSFDLVVEQMDPNDCVENLTMKESEGPLRVNPDSNQQAHKWALASSLITHNSIVHFCCLIPVVASLQQPLRIKTARKSQWNPSEILLWT